MPMIVNARKNNAGNANTRLGIGPMIDQINTAKIAIPITLQFRNMPKMILANMIPMSIFRFDTNVSTASNCFSFCSIKILFIR